MLLAALLLQATVPQSWVPTPDDGQWMRGVFAGASQEDKAAFQRTSLLLEECRKAATNRVRAELAAMGEAAPALREGSYGSEPCESADSLIPQQKFWGDWNAWVAANAQAKLLFAVFDYGVASRREPTTPVIGPNGLTRRLTAAIEREQAYRRALSWQNEGPPLDPLVWAALERRLWHAASAEDHSNTAMLKAIVAEHGWPTIQMVGEEASSAAWLLVQHADDDPAFQLRVLRLMAPLLATGGVSKRDYAYLYDRVMLKISGKQRYGSQARCVEGKLVALPLEDPDKVDSLRAVVGLGTLADYLATLDKHYGACSAG
jgi:hypothetical protein